MMYSIKLLLVSQLNLQKQWKLNVKLNIQTVFFISVAYYNNERDARINYAMQIINILLDSFDKLDVKRSNFKNYLSLTDQKETNMC